MRIRLPVAAAVALAASLILVATVAALDEGDRAPPITGPDLNGNSVSMRGVVTLVNFWATWCEPCADEAPRLQAMYGRLRERGFQVIGVSVDRNESGIPAFLSRHGIQYPIVHDANHALANGYRPPRMPSSYMTDRNGVVRHVYQGYRRGDEEEMERDALALLAERARRPGKRP